MILAVIKCVCVDAWGYFFRQWWGFCRVRLEAERRRASSCMTSSHFAS